MLPDHAKGKVLEELKDENLETGIHKHIAAYLKRVPAYQRQNVLAEHSRRTVETVVHRRADGSTMLEDRRLPKSFGRDVYEDILKENGW